MTRAFLQGFLVPVGAAIAFGLPVAGYIIGWTLGAGR
jgi:hypothetical protein